MKNLFIIIFGGLFFWAGCSQHSSSFVSRNFHNTTAYYNAYFLAKERMHEVEDRIWTAHQDDYNRILKIYPDVKETTSSELKTDLEYIIEKAALPINRHQNSNWVDDSYNLIGKSRLYENELNMAINTFKYVNTNADAEDARQAALIMLMRTFIDSTAIEEAKTVKDYLYKQPLAKKNIADFYLTNAWYFQNTNDLKNTVDNLEKSLPYLKDNDMRARVHFIIGQIHQELGNDAIAKENYQKVAKNNPVYELLFYSKLYSAQVTGISKGERKEVDKYFRKLLKDKKNEEYRDKIYYEMGKYELKQGNIDKAIARFNQSLEESRGNSFQKGRTYLAMGKLHYDLLENYETSKLYYDSTVSFWDKKNDEFPAIQKRQQVLDEFVTHLNTVKLEDSLQRLSKMDSTELDKLFDRIIVQEYVEEQQRIARENARAAKEKERSEETTSGFNRGSFTLYNPTAITKGKAEFRRNWGNRPLEDDWRRRNKQQQFTDNYEEDTEEVVHQEEAVDTKADSIAAAEMRKQQLYAAIPKDQAELDSSAKRLEESLFSLGRIYNLKLNEPEHAVRRFEQFIDKFPSSEKLPEVYYILHLIFKNKLDNMVKAEHYRNKLYEAFPNSMYARLLKNPNYLQENKQMNKEAEALYRTAYDLHRQGEYISSDSMTREIMKNYPNTRIYDKLEYLSILNMGETRNPIVLKDNLSQFIKEYNTSELLPVARELLETTEDYISKREASGFDVSSEIKYQRNFDDPHYFISVIQGGVNVNSLMVRFDQFNKEYNNQLTVEYKEVNDSLEVLTVKGFSSPEKTREYYKRLTDNPSFLSGYGSRVRNYSISDDNHAILLSSGRVEEYARFHKRFYTEGIIYGAQ